MRKGKIIRACQMAFNGEQSAKIADALNVSQTTVSNWRKHPLWEDTEKQLIAAEQKAVINEQLATHASSEKALAQG